MLLREIDQKHLRQGAKNIAITSQKIQAFVRDNEWPISAKVLTNLKSAADDLKVIVAEAVPEGKTMVDADVQPIKDKITVVRTTLAEMNAENLAAAGTYVKIHRKPEDEHRSAQLRHGIRDLFTGIIGWIELMEGIVKNNAVGVGR